MLLSNPIIAHRGAWKEFNLPQNSLAAFRKALEIGSGATEFDIHLTKDGIPVIAHDDDYNGLVIASHTYDELSRFRLSNNEILPKLTDFLRYGLYQECTVLVFELKSAPVFTHTLWLVDVIIETLPPLFRASKGIFILFNWEAALYFKKRKPEWNILYLGGDKSPEEIKKHHLNGLNYHYNVWLQHPSYFSDCRQLGLFYGSWTLNDWSLAKRFLEQKMLGITTDVPFHFLTQLNRCKLS